MKKPIKALVHFLCCLIVLFGIFAGYSIKNSLLEFFSQNYLVYVILFVVFMIVHFIYKRKFYFDYKLVIYYLAASLVLFGFCASARSTRGFGILDTYPAYTAKTYYEYWGSCYNGNSDISAWLKEKTGEEIPYVYVSISAGDGQHKLADSTVAIFEKMRNQAIEDFYTYENDDEINNHDIYEALDAYSGIRVYEDYFNKDSNEHYYDYSIENKVLSMADILTLANDQYVNINLECDTGMYTLKANGVLIQTEKYMAEEVYQ